MAASQPIDNDVTAAIFSIELQNDVDIIRKDRLPSTSIHVLEKISDEAHIDVQSFVEYDDVQGTTTADFESSDMEHSAPSTPLDTQKLLATHLRFQLHNTKHILAKTFRVIWNYGLESANTTNEPLQKD